MRKDQNGFAHHLLLLLIVIVVIGLVGWQVVKAQNPHKNQTQTAVAQGSPTTAWASQAVYAQLPDCSGNQLLTNMPIESSASYDMSPLGQLNGTGGHTFPTDHMYIYLSNYGTYNVVSPGTIYVTKIERSSRTVNGVDSSDASVFMMPCKQVGFYLNHVHPTDALNKAVPSTNDSSTNSCAGNSSQGSKQNAANNTVNTDCSQLATKLVKFTPGQVLATVVASSQQSAFDFGAQDARLPDLKLINPGFEDTATGPLTALKSTCPINYLPSSVQKTVYALPGFSNRPAAAKCGEIAQDKLGTLQGDWYEGPHVNYPADWAKELAIVHYNKNPSIAAISVGGELGQGGLVMYTPRSSGTINPEPSATKVGQLYCMMQDGTGVSDYNYGTGHKFLFELTDSKTLKAEYQTGSCTGNEAFSQPFTYSR